MSKGLELIEHIYYNKKVSFWLTKRQLYDSAATLAIEAQLEFDKNDFEILYNKLHGDEWLYLGRNGKTPGELLYDVSCKVNNKSFCQSFEHFYNFKPFLNKQGRRICAGVHFWYKELRYEVTGINVKTKEIRLISFEYDHSNFSITIEKKNKKLLEFNHSDWILFRNELAKELSGTDFNY